MRYIFYFAIGKDTQNSMKTTPARQVHGFQECILFMYVRATENHLDRAGFYFKSLSIIRIYNNLNLIYEFEY